MPGPRQEELDKCLQAIGDGVTAVQDDVSALSLTLAPLRFSRALSLRLVAQMSIVEEQQYDPAPDPDEAAKQMCHFYLSPIAPSLIHTE